MYLRDEIQEKQRVILVMDKMIDDLRNVLNQCSDNGDHGLEERYVKSIFF